MGLIWIFMELLTRPNKIRSLVAWIFDFCDYREFSRISHWILRVMRNYSHMELRYALAFIIFVGNPQVHLRVQYEQIIYSSNKSVFSHQVALEVLQEFQQRDHLLQLLRVLCCSRRPLERNDSIFYMIVARRLWFLFIILVIPSKR